MSRTCSRRYFIAVAVGVALFLWFQAPAAAQNADDASNFTVELLIQNLASEKYKTRELATRQLLKMGSSVVVPLTEAARSGEIEVALRAEAVLEKIFIDESPASDSAERSLIALSESTNGVVARQSERCLRSHISLREDRAIKQIEKLGARILYKSNDASRNGMLNGPRGIIINGRVTKPEYRSQMISAIILDKDWKGGDEGLWNLKRLVQVDSIVHIDGNGISQEAIDNLMVYHPGLILQKRGKASLGIQMVEQDQGAGCLIKHVIKGSAASKAGLLPFDIITKIDNQKTTTIDALINYIATKKPGDRVTVRFLRGGITRTLTVVLGGWNAA